MKNTLFKSLRYMNRFGLINGTKLLIKRTLHGKEENEKIIYLPTNKNGMHLRQDTSDWSTFDKIFLDYEYDHLVLNNINPRFIVDVGANVGFASIFFSNKFPNAKVVAIEPEDTNFQMLLKNTKSYKNVECIQSALWNEERSLRIINSNAEKWGFKVGEVDEDSTSCSNFNAITIPKLLDIYNIDRIDILKIDIEGAEKQLFSSNYESWIRKINIIIIELHDWLEPGCAKLFYSALSRYDFVQYHKGENIFIVINQ